MNREVEIYDLQLSDLDGMNIDYHEFEDVDNFRERLETVIEDGVAKLVKSKGRVVAAIGYVPFWPGVCEVWAVANLPIVNKGIYALTLKYAIEEFVVPKGFHRMQATVLKDDPSESFYEKIGFKSEGVLKEYDTMKRDYKMWARII
jgi:L-amino acid N-acyltransferase YncA